MAGKTFPAHAQPVILRIFFIDYFIDFFHANRIDSYRHIAVFVSYLIEMYIAYSDAHLTEIVFRKNINNHPEVDSGVCIYHHIDNHISASFVI